MNIYIFKLLLRISTALNIGKLLFAFRLKLVILLLDTFRLDKFTRPLSAEISVIWFPLILKEVNFESKSIPVKSTIPLDVAVSEVILFKSVCDTSCVISSEPVAAFAITVAKAASGKTVSYVSPA